MTYIVGQNVRSAVIGFDLFDSGKEEPILVVRTDEGEFFKSYWIKFGNLISCVVNFNGKTVGVGAKRFEEKIPLIISQFESNINKTYPIQVAILYTLGDDKQQKDNIIEFKKR